MLALGRAFVEDGPAEAQLGLRMILDADSLEPVQLKVNSGISLCYLPKAS